MAGWMWVVIVLAVLICGAVALWTVASQRRTRRLQDRFGPEYARTADAAGSRREAEAELAAREERHDTLNVRALSPDARRRYASRWEDVQAEFVEAPEEAVVHADELVNEVMSERGYPMENFEQRVADVSVDHPLVVENYRAAHRIVVAMDSGEASTERSAGDAALPSAVRRPALRSRRARHRAARHIGHGTGRSCTMNDRSQGLTTADIAGSGSSDETERKDLDERDAGSVEAEANRLDQPAITEPLLGPTESKRFSDEWRKVQSQFVDEPREAVEQADRLVADLMQRLASEFTETRSNLERQWDGHDDISTEELRVAMTRYRSFFERLLSA